jgi:hypothetical protein
LEKVLSLLLILLFVFPLAMYFTPSISSVTNHGVNTGEYSSANIFGNLGSKVSAAPQEPTPCSTCGGGGGGGGGSPPATVNYKIDVFGGNANIQIDSSTYSNGQSVTLDASTTYEIQAVSIASGYKFFQWETNSGSITNYERTPTYLNTGTNAGTLVLVLNGTSSNWAGFVQSGSINSVTGEFYVPSASFVSGGTNPNSIGIWVGIGGFSQNSAIWQAGVAVNVSSSGVETVTPWYEMPPAIPIYNNNMHLNPGNLVQVWTNYSNGVSTFEIKDYTTGQFWGKSVSFTPATNTAEWIVEDPGSVSHPTVPNYGDVTWSLASSNSGNLLSEIVSFTEINGNQMSYCGYITEPYQFVVDYSG